MNFEQAGGGGAPCAPVYTSSLTVGRPCWFWDSQTIEILRISMVYLLYQLSWKRQRIGTVKSYGQKDLHALVKWSYPAIEISSKIASNEKAQ